MNYLLTGSSFDIDGTTSQLLWTFTIFTMRAWQPTLLQKFFGLSTEEIQKALKARKSLVVKKAFTVEQKDVMLSN